MLIPLHKPWASEIQGQHSPEAGDEELRPDSPRTLLMTLAAKGRPPTLADAARHLGVEESGLNAEFGVVLVDPANGVYCVEVYAASLPTGSGADRDGTYRGPFSNPGIEHAGLSDAEGTDLPEADQGQ